MFEEPLKASTLSLQNKTTATTLSEQISTILHFCRNVFIHLRLYTISLEKPSLLNLVSVGYIRFYDRQNFHELVL